MPQFWLCKLTFSFVHCPREQTLFDHNFVTIHDDHTSVNIEDSESEAASKLNFSGGGNNIETIVDSYSVVAFHQL